MSADITGEWLECIVDTDYEINSEYPYNIRRIGSSKVINECVDRSTGYVICHLNRHKYSKHRIVAKQFIPNPDSLPDVDHINHNRTDYHIENLRWVSKSQNNSNISSHLGIDYKDIEELSDEAIEVTDYNNHEFEFLYYDEDDDSFYLYTGVNYRKLHVNISAKGYAFINAQDTNNKHVKIFYNIKHLSP